MINKSTILAIMLALVCSSVFAHSGRTDADGCHHETATGEYHCHSDDDSNDNNEPSRNESYDGEYFESSDADGNTLGYMSGEHDSLVSVTKPDGTTIPVDKYVAPKTKAEKDKEKLAASKERMYQKFLDGNKNERNICDWQYTKMP